MEPKQKDTIWGLDVPVGWGLERAVDSTRGRTIDRYTLKNLSGFSRQLTFMSEGSIGYVILSRNTAEYKADKIPQIQAFINETVKEYQSYAD